MLKGLLSVFSLAAVLPSPGAVSINLTGNPDTGPAFFSGPVSVVPDGSLIRVGTFVTPPAPNDSFATLSAAFHEFTRTTMGNSSNVNTGHPVRNSLTGSNTPDSPDPDSFFTGKNVYIWVYNTPIPDISAAQGVYSSDIVFEDALVPVSATTTGFVNAFGAAPFSTPASVTVNPGNGLVTRFNLATGFVPEPGVPLLCGLAALLGTRRRR